jgi:hypothetical protein
MDGRKRWMEGRDGWKEEMDGRKMGEGREKERTYQEVGAVQVAVLYPLQMSKVWTGTFEFRSGPLTSCISFRN